MSKREPSKNETNEKDEDEWEKWKGYMQAKKNKLQAQFLANQSKAKSDIFKGVAIFVNGHTEPPADVLKVLMRDHGGMYHMYKSSTTTHTVVSTLAKSKIDQLTVKDMVIRADWIIDSIAEGRKLPINDYLLVGKKLGYGAMEQFVLKPSSTSIDLSFTSKTISRCRNTPNSQHSPTKKEKYHNTEDTDTANEKTVFDKQAKVDSTENVFPTGKTVEKGSQSSNEGDVIEPSPEPQPKRWKSRRTKVSDVCSNDGKDDTNDRMAKIPRIDSKDATVHPRTHDDLDVRESDSTSNLPVLIASRLSQIQPFNAQAVSETNKSPQKSPVALKNFPKTTDDNFLKEFYTRSRLHFLSTWGQEMKTLVKKLRSQSDGKFDGRDLLNRAIPSADAMFAECEKVYMHIDMDCFFVSVALRNHPQLKGKPVAVTHSKAKKPLDHSTGSNFESKAEIASCSYEARTAGVKNGMLMGQALKLCPALVPVPYDFEGYHSTSVKLYETVARFTVEIEAVSCDELYANVTEICDRCLVSPLELSTALRAEIEKATNCTCSIGMGSNLLLARLATRKAKPNGQFWVRKQSISNFMSAIKVQDLPGVGWSTRQKLTDLLVETCGDLSNVPLQTLKRTFGDKAGQNLYNMARGRDDRDIRFDVARKSVSCDVNYGIRMQEVNEVQKFFSDLSTEIEKRLREAEVLGQTFTLKLLVRSKDAPIEPSKFGGCGKCDAFTKSVTVSKPTLHSAIILKEAMTLFRQISPVIQDLRGIGITVTRLRPINVSTVQSNPKNGIAKYFDSVKESAQSNQSRSEKVSLTSTKSTINSSAKRSHEKSGNSASETSDFRTSLSQIDKPLVLNELPEEIRSEVVEQFKKQQTADQPKQQQGSSKLESRSSHIQPAIPGPNAQNENEISKSKLHPDKPSSSKIGPCEKTAKPTRPPLVVPDCEPGPSTRPDVFYFSPQATLDADEEVRKIQGMSPTSDEFDPDVLAALPDDLRAEIEDEQRRKQIEKQDRQLAKQLCEQIEQRSPSREMLWDYDIPPQPRNRGVRRTLFPKMAPNTPTQETPTRELTEEDAMTITQLWIPRVGVGVEAKKTKWYHRHSLAITRKYRTIRIKPRSKRELTKKAKAMQWRATKPQLFGETCYEDAKQILRDIVHHTESPSKEEVDKISAYLTALVRRRDLNNTQQLMSVFRRFIQRSSHYEWQSVYDQLINDVQASVISIGYGSIKGLQPFHCMYASV